MYRRVKEFPARNARMTTSSYSRNSNIKFAFLLFSPSEIPSIAFSAPPNDGENVEDDAQFKAAEVCFSPSPYLTSFVFVSVFVFGCKDDRRRDETRSVVHRHSKRKRVFQQLTTSLSLLSEMKRIVEQVNCGCSREG